MILVFRFFTVALPLCVVALLFMPLPAIWGSMRAQKEFQKLERERRRQSH